MPSTTATSAASSEPSHRFTSVVARTDPDWASAAGRSSAAMPGCWRTSASPYATTGSTSSCSRCFRPPAYSWLQVASPDNSENRLYVLMQYHQGQVTVERLVAQLQAIGISI